MTETRAGNIIIVEDNLIIATETRKRLEKAGYNILGSFESGEELIENLDKLDPDIVLMDIMLKGKLSGIDTTKIILQTIDIPVIYLTAYSDRDTLSKAKETGPFAYLVKPVSKEDLLVNIEMALHNHRAKRKSEEDLIITSSLEHLDDAIFIISENMGVQYLNTSAIDIFQIEDTSNLDIHEILIDKIDLYKAPDFISKDKLTRLNNKFSHDVIIKKDKKLATLSVTPVKNVSNEIVGRVFIVKLKDDSKTIRLLQESEERFRSVLENIQLLAFMMDSEGSIFFCNDYLTSITGWDKSALLNSNWFSNYVCEESKDKLLLEYLSENKGEYPNHNSYKIITKAKECLTIKWNNIPIRDKTSNIIGFTCIGEDISDKIRAEEELKNNQIHLEKLVEERTLNLKELNKKLTEEIEKHKIADEQNKYHLNFLETLIETAPSPIFIKDTDKKYIKCNKAFEKYFGFEKHQVLGKTEDIVLPKDLVEKVNQIEDELLREGGERLYEGKITNRVGEEKEFIVTKSIFRKADQSVGGIIAVAVDVTEMKNLEKDLALSLKKEKELNELKSSFISTASHEFRTPLTSIITSADLLEMFGQNWGEEKYKTYIAKIQNAVGKMTELLEDVLAVNKGESKKLVFSPTLNNLKHFCLEIIEETLHSCDQKRDLELNYTVEEENFNFDRKLLLPAFQNLLSNAIKYSGNNTKITVDVYQKNTNIIIAVTDEGIGIPKDDLKIIFEPFYRAKNIGNISGTGLGLSIVKKAVETHKGKLELESNENKGTQFKIILPLNLE